MGAVGGVEELLTGGVAERRVAVARILAVPDGPRCVEAALLDLLREAGDEVLSDLAVGLAGHRADPAAVRVLETLARQGGRVRAVALKALRGVVTSPPEQDGLPQQGARAQQGARVESPVAPLARIALTVTVTPTETASGPEASSAGPDAAGQGASALAALRAVSAESWEGPFEAVLAQPTSERIALAAMALVELAEHRPPGATREALQALAGRLAMGSFDHEGEAQKGMTRLARGLKGL